MGGKTGEDEDRGAPAGVLKVVGEERGDAGQWCDGKRRLRRRKRKGKVGEGEEDEGVYNGKAGCEGSKASCLNNDRSLSHFSSPYPSFPFPFSSPMPFPTPLAPPSPSPSPSLSPLPPSAPSQQPFAPSLPPCVCSSAPLLRFDRH